jgi:A/G-specific adenine glycosylase
MTDRRNTRRGLVRSLLSWYGRSRRDLPWRRSRRPYNVWISEVMLQQTTVRAVLPYYARFVSTFPTIAALAGARLSDVLAAWSGLGYYRRARHLHAAARLIVRRHGGRFPRRLEDALALPGIGRYTAGAILSIAYGERLPVVDGNVARVLSRLFLLHGSWTPARGRELWDRATDLVTATGSPGDLNQALMELGATVCTPRNPSCPTCPVTQRCLARAAGAQDRVPPPRPTSRPPVTVSADLAVVSRNGRLLLRRRTDRTLMHGLWEFPTLAPGGATDGLRLELEEPVATIHHSITYRRLELRVRPARLLSEPTRGLYRWLRPADLRQLPTSSIVHKVLAVLEKHESTDEHAGAKVGSRPDPDRGSGPPRPRGRLRPRAGAPPRASQRGGQREAKRGEARAASRTRAARARRPAPPRPLEHVGHV